jgi:hypothetical protein
MLVPLSDAYPTRRSLNFYRTNSSKKRTRGNVGAALAAAFGTRKGGFNDLLLPIQPRPGPLRPRFLSIKSIRRFGGALGHVSITWGMLWGDFGGALGALRGRFWVANFSHRIHNLASSPNFSSSLHNPTAKPFFFSPPASLPQFTRRGPKQTHRSQSNPPKTPLPPQKSRSSPPGQRFFQPNKAKLLPCSPSL